MGFPHLEVKWTPTLMGITLNVVSEDAAAVDAFGVNLGSPLDSLFSGSPPISASILDILQAAVRASKGGDSQASGFPVTATVRFPGVKAANDLPGTASRYSSTGSSASAGAFSSGSFSSVDEASSEVGRPAWDLHAFAEAASVSEATACIVAVPAVVGAVPKTTDGKGDGRGVVGGPGVGKAETVFGSESLDPLTLRLLGYAFDHLHDIFTVANFEGMLEKVNPVTERILGWSAEDLTTKPYQYFLHPDDVERTNVLVDGDMAKGMPVSRFTNRWRKKKGGWATISWHAVPVLDEGKIIAIGRDVTAEIEARAVAMRAVERLRVIVDSVNDGIIECDMHGRILSVDGGLRQLLACPADPAPIPFVSVMDFVVQDQDAFEVSSDGSDDGGDGPGPSCTTSGKGNSGFHFNRKKSVNDDDVPLTGEELVTRVLARRVTQNVRLWRTDRSEVLVDMTAAVFAPGGDDKAKTVIITIRDVADRVHAENEARAHSDAVRRLEVKNEFVASISHEIRTPLNGILGAVETLMDEELPERHLELIATAYDCGSTLLSTINAILEDSKDESTLGESINLDWFILRAVVDDALVAVRSRAEAGNVALSCDVDDSLPAMLKGDAGRFRQVLLNLLSNAVKFSSSGDSVSVRAWRIDCPERGVLAASPAPARARPMTSSSGSSSSSSNCEHSSQNDGSDRERNNACSGHTGSIGRSSAQSSRSGKSGSSAGQMMWMRLEIRDTGVGIDKDKLETIFQAFTQADASIAKVYGGTGLGLNICRRIIEAMHGHIWAESEPGVGSTFIVECPFARSRKAASQSSGLGPIGEGPEYQYSETPCGTANPDRAQHRSDPLQVVPRVPDSLSDPPRPAAGPGAVTVLVIDDFPPNLLVIKSILSHLGCMVDTSRSAEEALSLISSEDSPVYSLILTDVNMPRMNGIDFTQRVVKQMGYPAPIVVVTAGGDTHRESAFEAGACGYLKKPVSKSSLHGIVTKYTSLVSPSEEIDAPELQVLYADDAEINGDVARLILDSLGSSLTFVDNAGRALRALVAAWSCDAPASGHGGGPTVIHPSEVNSAFAAVGVDPFHPDLEGEAPPDAPPGGYDIVFFDEHMPGMNGTAAVRVLRSIEGAHGLPRTFVALLSGETGRAFEREATNAGADMVLAKPFTKRSFRVAITAALKRRRRNAVNASRNSSSSRSVLSQDGGGDPGSVRSRVGSQGHSSPSSQSRTGDFPPAPVIDAEAVVDLGTLPIIPRVLDLTTEELDSWSAAAEEARAAAAASGVEQRIGISARDYESDNGSQGGGQDGSPGSGTNRGHDDSNDGNDGNDSNDPVKGYTSDDDRIDGARKALALSKLHKIKGAAGNVGLACLATVAEGMESQVKEHGCPEPEKMIARLRRELEKVREAMDDWKEEE